MNKRKIEKLILNRITEGQRKNFSLITNSLGIEPPSKKQTISRINTKKWATLSFSNFILSSIVSLLLLRKRYLQLKELGNYSPFISSISDLGSFWGDVGLIVAVVVAMIMLVGTVTFVIIDACLKRGQYKK